MSRSFALVSALTLALIFNPPVQAGPETLENVTVQVPNSWSVPRVAGQLVLRSSNNSVFLAALADPVATERISMADRPGSERDGLFDALTNRAVLRRVEVILEGGGNVRCIQKDPATDIQKDRGFVFGTH